MYIYIYIYIHRRVYIYIYRERERDIVVSITIMITSSRRDKKSTQTCFPVPHREIRKGGPKSKPNGSWASVRAGGDRSGFK